MSPEGDEIPDSDPEIPENGEGDGEGENILTLTPPPEEKKKSSAKRKKAEDFKWDEIKDWFNGLVSSAGCKLKKMREFTPQRKTAFRNAIRTFGREKVAEAIRKATTVPFLNGDNDTDWRAGFDFLVNVNKIPRILEGCYDHLRREQKKTIIHEHRSAGVFDAYNEIVKQLENGTDTDSTASGGYDDNAAILAAIGG